MSDLKYSWQLNGTYVYVLGDQVQSLTFENFFCFHQGMFVMSQGLVEC